MLYALRRFKTHLYLDHLFEDTADKLFQGTGLRDAYKYTVEQVAHDVAKRFAEDLLEPVEIVEVGINPNTLMYEIRQQGLVFGI